MKVLQISAAVAFLAALAQAAPAPASKPVPSVTLDFSAAPTSYALTFLCDNNVHPISNTPSVNEIHNLGGCTCEVIGIDGSNYTIPSGGSVTVGPPQQQISAQCYLV